MAETKLLPCPFCGGKASQWDFKRIAGRGAEIECVKCQAKIQRVTLIEAIEAWNKRVPQTVVQQYGEHCISVNVPKGATLDIDWSGGNY